MLFNTAWNKTPEVKPVDEMLSTANLVAWLEKQPADKSYDYESPHHCLLAQYFHQHGYSHARVGNHFVHWLDGEKAVGLPRAFHAAATYEPRTFGAALRRAKAYL